MNRASETLSIQYVDELPRVNLTDHFLVLKKEKDNFGKNLREFFPYYMEKYLVPEALGIVSGEVKLLKTYGLNKSSYIGLEKLKDLPKGIKQQKAYAEGLLNKIKTYDQLCEILTHKGHEQFLIKRGENIFTLKSYKDVFEVLTGIKKWGLRAPISPVQLFSVFLHEKRIALWPIRYFKKERFWKKISRSPFAPQIQEEMQKATLKAPQLKRLRNTSHFIFKATTWGSLHDILPKDITSIRERVKRSNDPNTAEYMTVLHNLAAAGEELGVAGLRYEPEGVRGGKSQNKGRVDGTFSYYEAMKPFLSYWISHAKDFIEYQAKVSNLARETLKGYCGGINRFFDYLLYLDSLGQTLSKVEDIKRDLHITFKSPAGKEEPQTFTKFVMGRNVKQNQKKHEISTVRTFLQWIILTEGINIANPITDFDVPPKGRQPLKTLRYSLTTEMYKTVREILLYDPPPHYEDVLEKGEGWVKKLSPTLPTYMLCRLSLSIRHGQTAYLDLDKVIDNKDDKEMIVISGDKNTNRKFLQIIPPFDKELVARIKKCQEWQRKYNSGVNKTEPVWYGGNTNSPYGEITPLFRLIGRDPNPIGRRICDMYMKKVLLVMQERLNLQGKDQLVTHKNGEPIDMSMINPATMTHREMDQFKTDFDLHSFRTTAATVMFEHGVPIEDIMKLTGHMTITMLMYYVQARNTESTYKDALENIIKLGDKAFQELKEAKDIDEVISRLRLLSRVLNPKYEDMEGVKIIKTTPRPVWRPMLVGICPTGACPDNLNGRCSLCPHLISGPCYKTQFAMMANLILEQIHTLAAEMKVSADFDTKYDVSRGAKLESFMQEWIGCMNWIAYIDSIEEEAAQKSGIQLYTQVKYEATETSRFALVLQRCIDINACPKLYTEAAAHNAKMLLRNLLAYIPKGTSLQKIIDALSPKETIEKTAKLLLDSINAGKTAQDFEKMALGGLLTAQEGLLLESSIKEGSDAEGKN